MLARKEIFKTLRTALAIGRTHRGHHRRELLRAHLFLQWRRLRDSGRAPGSLRIFGKEIAYFSGEAMSILLNEVLVDEPYYIHLPGPSPFIVDGGANIGVAVLLFKQLYPHSEILAFEPDPDTFQMLERNVSAYGPEGVQLVNAALGNAEKEVDLCFDPDVPGNLGMSTKEVPELKGRRKVQSVLLSSHLDRRVDLLKLDVEGSEHEVIADLVGTGKIEKVDRIVMEYHHHMTPDEDRLGRLLEQLESRGFGYQILSRPRLPFRDREFSCMFVYAYRKRCRD